MLKKEFDTHRARKSAHPLMKAYGIKAVPFLHQDIDLWRENFKGVRFLHEPSGFLVTGAVDDVWVDKSGQLIVVDYKATSKAGEVTLDGVWQKGYKRQMDIYQWLLRQQGFKVSNRGYFVYVNGRTDLAAFDGKLEFVVKLLPYDGDGGWIEQTLLAMKKCLRSSKLPKASAECDHCSYIEAVKGVA
ncbi:MAG: PD-(D/E)XK nuclease family protein [Patescibacteria group bacterium]